MTSPDPVLESEYLALLEAEDYARAEADLGHFIRSAWEVLEPGVPYLHNWHIDAIADHLEAVRLGQIRKLIINMPPRNMKSIAVTVCFPCWIWLRHPEKRFLASSFSGTLSTKHNSDRRTLIQSPWFQKAWGDRFKLESDQNQKTFFQNDKRGVMFATSVGTSAIGHGGDFLIIDDPLNPKEAASDVERENANTWCDQFCTRGNNKKTVARILVMQRLHEKDPAGHLISKPDQAEPWTLLCLEGKATKRHTVVFPVSKREVTRAEGEYLHPEREGEAEHKELFASLGSAGYQAQYQQDPTPQAGGFFKRSWWKFYKELPMERKRRAMFIDCAEKPGLTNDFTVIATWDETETGYYAVDLWAKKVTFPELEGAVLSLFDLHKPDLLQIEDKSAGTQLIQNLRAKTSLPVLAFDPGRRKKEVRAAGVQPTVEAGNCHLPAGRSWVEMFIGQHEKFPNDEHDDLVDTTSMMIEFFRQQGQGPRIRFL